MVKFSLYSNRLVFVINMNINKFSDSLIPAKDTLLKDAPGIAGIIGGVIGTLLVVALIAIVVILILRMQRKRSEYLRICKLSTDFHRLRTVAIYQRSSTAISFDCSTLIKLNTGTG